MIICFMFFGSLSAETDLVNQGRWNEALLTQVLNETNRIDSPGARIVAISSHFINTPYAAKTLIGGPRQAERLVIDLTGFDCFTLLDTVEALRRSATAADLVTQMKQVRYRLGKVDYAERRHFFSDWVVDGATGIVDVTAQVGQDRVRRVVKQINLKSDGSFWLSGIPVVSRNLCYVPATEIDSGVLEALHQGDYVGIFSELAGLDVSHVGLIVKSRETVMLRHATSRSGVERVIDEELLEYLRDKPGLVVYRVKP